ncbi:MAG: hypothetical protein ACRDHI_01065 [Actinomycetota bacterium]
MEGRRLRDEHLDPLASEVVQTDRPNIRAPGFPAVGRPGRLDDAVQRWQEAEDRLHPIAVASPETYERYLELIRAIAGELGPIATREQLVEADPRSGAIADRAVTRTGLAAEGLDLRLAAGAAFAVRDRVLAVEERRREASRRVCAAAGRGDDWVVVDESGDGVMTPYRRLEMHLPDGAGLVCSIDADLEGGPTVFGVQVVALDPRTGRVEVGQEPAEGPLTFPEERSWREAITDLRARLESPS